MLARRSLLALSALLVAKPAFAAWPDQPVKLVVPFTPGTGPDIIARFVGEKLATTLGQPVVIDNVAGASGNIGSAQVARAKPDAYTLMSSVNTLVMNASLFKTLPYDPVADFQPITLTAWGSLVLVAHPSQAPNNVAELVVAAKAKPRVLTYGSPGVGTPHHLSMALVETATGIDVDMWYGLFAPRGTPMDLVERLNRDVAAILAAPEARAAFEAQGLVPASSTPAALAEIVVRDRARWAEVVAKRGIVPE